MISVEDKQICFTPAGRKNPRIKRDAAFAHVCPGCGMLIHGLALSGPKDKVPRSLHAEGGHPLEIDLKVCGQANLIHVYVPEYETSFISLDDGQRGQYFIEKYHMCHAGMRSIGRCKYVRGVDCFSSSPAQQALRQAGILRIFFGAEQPEWEKFHQKLQETPQSADVALGKMASLCGSALDAAEKTSPVVLFSKADWKISEFKRMLEAVLALPGKEAINVEV